MDDFDYDIDPTKPFLTAQENKQVVEIMKKTGVVPQPATDQEITTIIAWLAWTKKDWPNLMTYEYKDCCFQKDNNVWELSHRNKDLMYSELLYRRI